jgi:hypothetical protein
MLRGFAAIEVMDMGTATLTVHDVIMEKLNNGGQDGYRALDLINQLDSYQESEVQKGLAQLLSEGSVIITTDRKLKLK